MKKFLRKPWFRIFLVYLLFGVTYIYFSDRVVEFIFSDSESITFAQTVKGWLFILFSGLLIAWLVLRETRKQKILNEELVRRVAQLNELNKELVQAKNKAEENDRLKTAFLNNMSHEVRTPLNGIMGFAGLLADESVGEERKRKYITIIRNSVNRLIKLIDDILDLSRIDSGQLHLVSERVDLDELFDHLARSAQERIEKSGRDIQLKLTRKPLPSSSTVFYDRSRLYQLMSELLDNAIKFTQHGFIRIAYELTGNRLIMEVEDTGYGIEEKNIGRIFDRFVQCHNEDIRAAGGTGIGLTLIKGIIDKMNGEIEVRSEAGRGSLFTVILPDIRPSKELERGSAGVELGRLEGRTVLIVDDVSTSTELVKEMIGGIGLRILTAENGAECLTTYLQQPEIELIIMDILMPVMDGYEALREIRKINARIPIIAQTAYAMEYDREKVLAAGFDDYIPKPVSRNTLLGIFNKYLN